MCETSDLAMTLRSYRSNNATSSTNGLRRVIRLSIVPYSCLLFSMCCAYADYDSSGLHTSGCTCGISVGKCPVYCVVGFLFSLLF